MSEQGHSAGISPALQVAQQQLDKLRQKRRKERRASGLPVRTDAHGRFLPAAPNTPCENRPSISQLPPHLGWGSHPLTAALRNAHQRQIAQQERQEPIDLSWIKSSVPSQGPTAVSSSSSPANGTVKLYPDIALALLRQEEATTGRIWLLLRYIDQNGRGWIPIKEAKAQLTHKSSPLRVCGWRQLRNLLAQGEGIFWHRENGRLWLRSTAKVAAALNVWKLNGYPVALPVAVLTRGIGDVRAHLYATFHSSRHTIIQEGNPQTAKPIARATLQELTHVNRRTQIHYEKRANVQKRHNFAVGARASALQEQKAAWKHGQAMFYLTDHQGQQGPPGVTYLAWQLPNHYLGPHARRPRGQQKRINRELADLFTKGMTGNGRLAVDGNMESSRIPPKRFYANGRLAAKAYNRSVEQDIYWRGHRYCTLGKANGRGQIWHCLPGKGAR